MICDFKYELLTGAGFEVDRRGVAAITSQGPAVEVLWTASTRERYVNSDTPFWMFVPVYFHLISQFFTGVFADSRKQSKPFETLPVVSVATQTGSTSRMS